MYQQHLIRLLVAGSVVQLICSGTEVLVRIVAGAKLSLPWYNSTTGLELIGNCHVPFSLNAAKQHRVGQGGSKNRC